MIERMHIILLIGHCISDVTIPTVIEVFPALSLPAREVMEKVKKSRGGTQIVDNVSAFARKSTRRVRIPVLSGSRKKRGSSENFSIERAKTRIIALQFYARRVSLI